MKRILERYGKVDVVATINDVEGLLDSIKTAEEKNLFAEEDLK